MKALYFTLVWLLSLASVRSDMTGTWLSDWQNTVFLQGKNLCFPSSFVITDAGTGQYNISVTFDSQDGTPCHQNYNSPLTLSQENPTLWFDDYFIYNYIYNSSSYITLQDWASQANGLYDRNGSIIPQEAMPNILSLDGVWQITGSDCENAPPHLIISLALPFTFPNYNITTYGFTPSGQIVTTSGLQFTQGTQQLNWIPTYYGGGIQILVSPETNQISFNYWVNSSGPANCTNINYQKANQTLISGSWIQDNHDLPRTNINYEIQIVDNAYMVSYCNFYSPNQSGRIYGLVSGTTDSLYYDTILHQTTYYPALDILMAPGLFTPNGSYFSNPDVIGNWSNPKTQQTQCCIPQWISVTNNTNISSHNMDALMVDYYFPPSLWNLTWCSDLASGIVDGNGIVTSYLNIDNTFVNVNENGQPSLHANWNDDFGFHISSDDTDSSDMYSDTSIPTITVTYQGCNFAMQLESRPGPNPNPKSTRLMLSSWISVGLMLLLINII